MVIYSEKYYIENLNNTIVPSRDNICSILHLGEKLSHKYFLRIINIINSFQ